MVGIALIAVSLAAIGALAWRIVSFSALGRSALRPSREPSDTSHQVALTPSRVTQGGTR